MLFNDTTSFKPNLLKPLISKLNISSVKGRSSKKQSFCFIEFKSILPWFNSVFSNVDYFAVLTVDELRLF